MRSRRQLFILPFLCMSHFCIEAKAETRSVDTYLKARKVVLDQFAALKPDQKKQKEVASAVTANILFFRAQQARLREEIVSSQNEEKTATRDWQAQAARLSRQSQERALNAMIELERNPPRYAIRCMRDINAADMSGNTKQFLSDNSRIYSKSMSAFADELQLDVSRGRASNKSQSPAVRDAISREVLSRRLPKTLSAPRERSPSVSPIEAQSLDAFGVSPSRPLVRQKDMSDLFTRPKLQPPGTAMCAGYAISSDMEATLNNGALFQLHSVSPTYAYKALLAGESGAVKSSGLCPLITANRDPLLGVGSISLGLKNLSSVPVCSTDDPKTSRLKTTQFFVQSARSFSRSPSLDYVKALLSAGIAPMAVVASEKRSETENWIYPQTGGRFQHIVNVVGYGTAREPDCLDQTEYLVIRDSLGKKPIHYRVNAQDFLRQTIAVHKITGVREDVMNRLNPLNRVGARPSARSRSGN